jgi:hypothetical protein
VKNPTIDDFEGYQRGDISYCIDPKGGKFFPVRVVKIGQKFADVESLNSELTKLVALDFDSDQKNRRFVRPKLGPSSRFGGYDERIVNSERISGQELRLLPYHYPTLTGSAIKEHHQEDPQTWPLPTGVIYERWFKDK